MKRTGGFRSEAEVERLWDSMVKKAVGLIGKAVAGVQGADLLLKVKNILALFIQTMDVSFELAIPPGREVVTDVVEWLGIVLGV